MPGGSIDDDGRDPGGETMKWQASARLLMVLATGTLACATGHRSPADAAPDSVPDQTGTDAVTDLALEVEADAPAPCDPAFAAKATEGRKWLEGGEPLRARDAFVDALALCPDDPASHFGAAMGEMAYGTELLMALLTVLQGQATGPTLPKAVPAEPFFLLDPHAGPSRNDYIAAEIHGILLGVRDHFAAGVDHLDAIGDRDPAFASKAVPVSMGVKPMLVFRGAFDAGDVQLMRAIGSFATGVFDFLAGQSLDTDLMTLLGEMSHGLSGSLDFPKISRIVAYVLDQDDRFLRLDPVDGERLFVDARQRFAAVGPALRDALAAARTPAAGGMDVSLVEVHGGDSTLTVCCRVRTDADGKTVEEPMSFTLAGQTVDAFVAASDSILAKGPAVTLHGAVLPILATLVSAGARSGVLDAFGLKMPAGIDLAAFEIEDLSMLLKGLLPNAVAFDWGAFFSKPVGLRAWLPAVTTGKGHLEDIIRAEWECPGDLQPDGYPTGSLRLLCAKGAALADGPHFVGTPDEIPADGVASGFPVFVFPDPTLNDLAHVDLDSAVGDADSSHFALADRASLNSALALVLGDVLGLLAK